jgi:outer membrane protein assembly factor BamB
MINEFSTCVMADGYLYGSSGDANGLLPFRCIDMKTGEVMWEKRMKMVSLIVAAGKLIMLEEDGTLHIAEAASSSYKEISSGNIVVGKRTFEKFWTPPVLYKGKIYCRDRSRFLFCVDVSK